VGSPNQLKSNRILYCHSHLKCLQKVYVYCFSGAALSDKAIKRPSSKPVGLAAPDPVRRRAEMIEQLEGAVAHWVKRIENLENRLNQKSQNSSNLLLRILPFIGRSGNQKIQASPRRSEGPFGASQQLFRHSRPFFQLISLICRVDFVYRVYRVCVERRSSK